ncbi:MAG: tripartite tricarboxylate transporter substrate binding protein BugD [Xanthobacteraceae bacterium]|nr:tripartite tricarboxylate transporter substrate binding protein BugD [Xanthobacteraceae bacterium]
MRRPAALCLLLLLAAPAAAQEWPTRPLTMVVPYAAGGPVDTLGRIIGAGLGDALGQQVIIENVGGAGGMTGSNRVAKAAPDGYTMLMGGSAVLAQIPALYKHPLYDAATDFAPVALVTDSARVLIARKDFPANNFKDFLAYAKTHQDSMKYGTAGVGSGAHICAILLDQALGTKITQVPYRGTAAAMQDIVGGRIDALAEQISTALPQIQGKAVKAMATMGTERAPGLEDLPTAAEQGYPGLDCGAWGALVFPKGTPDAIVRRLAKAASDTVDQRAIRERLAEIGVTVPAVERRTPEYLAKFIPTDIARWAEPIRASGVSAD